MKIGNLTDRRFTLTSNGQFSEHNQASSLFPITPIGILHQPEIQQHLHRFFSISRIFTGIPSIKFGPRNSTLFSKPKTLSGVFLWTLISFTFQLLLLIFAISQNASTPLLIIRIHSIAVYCWNFLFVKQFISALFNSPSIEKRLKIYNEFSDAKNLRKITNWITFIFAIFGFILVMSITSIFLFWNINELNQSWEIYCKTFCNFQPNGFLHFSIENLICFFGNVLAYYVWIFPDFLLILLSIIFANFFHRLNRSVRVMDPTRFSVYEVDLIREHFGILVKLIEDFDDAIAFLTLVSVFLNLAFILAQGYNIGLFRTNPQDSVQNPMLASSIVLFAIASIKFLIALSSAAFMYYKGRAAATLVRSWSTTRTIQEYSLNTGRINVVHCLSSQLTNGPHAGFTLGKFLSITPKLLLQILSGVILAYLFFTLKNSQKNSSPLLQNFSNRNYRCFLAVNC